MSKNMDTGHGTAGKPGYSSERLDNPPLWSPWNFQTKQRDWHEDFFDEMSSSASHGEEK
jgi:hypothetical protein